MAAPDIRTTKVLCHPDGSLFCNYHPDAAARGYVHAVYMTEAAVAPDPTTLGIIMNPDNCTDVADLVWFELEAFVRPIPRREQAAGTFNYDTAEWIGKETNG